MKASDKTVKKYLLKHRDEIDNLMYEFVKSNKDKIAEMKFNIPPTYYPFLIDQLRIIILSYINEHIKIKPIADSFKNSNYLADDYNSLGKVLDDILYPNTSYINGSDPDKYKTIMLIDGIIDNEFKYSNKFIDNYIKESNDLELKYAKEALEIAKIPAEKQAEIDKRVEEQNEFIKNYLPFNDGNWNSQELEKDNSVEILSENDKTTGK